MVNSAAAASPVQPIANLGQGFFGYNPPALLLNAAKEALNRVDCNQYSPTKGRPRLKKALATSYAPLLGKSINPETDIAITTGANEGMLCAMMAFVEPGDEIVVFEPFFDQYIPSIELAGATAKFVPLSPPSNASTKKTAASDWVFDMETLRQAVTPKTKMLNPLGKVFSRGELLAIGEICVKNSIIILSDEVYDRLSYVPFTRIATLSPEISSHTLTVGSVGKAFYATGWRVGFLIGPEAMIKYVSTTHTRVCYATPGPQQEAAAVGYEEADLENFWEESKADIQRKMNKFNAIWDELGLPVNSSHGLAAPKTGMTERFLQYTEPQGGYFVLVNTSKIRIPEDYVFPAELQDKPRDYRLSWFIIQELGVAAIPTSGSENHSPSNF
ncbi:MAG: hypothetical protein Q9161_007423 [Pseudevernia consocians]